MSQIDRVNTSFSNFLRTPQGGGNEANGDYSPTPYTRYKGGHKGISSPFISGYWYVLIELPELKIKSYIDTDTKSKNLFTNDTYTRNKMMKYLHGTAEAFTPPSKTIQKGEISGFGGIKKYVILNQSITSNFSISFFELSGMPIQKIFKIWSNMINSNYGYRQAEIYKGRAFIFLCKPTWTGLNLLYNPATNLYEPINYGIGRDDIEEMFYFEGVFPESDGNDALQMDISENGLIKYQVQFSFDSYYFGVEHDDIVSEGLAKFTEIIGNVKFPNIDDILVR